MRSVQRGVTALLEALVHHGLAALPLARQPGSPASMPPPLMLLKDLLIQVSVHGQGVAGLQSKSA